MADRYARIVQALHEQPWAIIPSHFEALVDIVRFRVDGGVLSAGEIQARLGDRERPSAVARSGSIAVLALHGPVSQRMNLFSAISGGTSTELFGRDFDSAMADPDVNAIVLSIDSPGGSVAGVEELAQKIYKARGTKPIVAVADSLAASAAYWIGSQADEFVASPSAQVGSIGIVTSHRDVSKAEDAMGVKTTVIAIPEAKVEAHPYAPLSEDALTGVLASMQPYYDLFVKAVARGRGVSANDVKNGYGQGRVLAAVPAKAAGMVDRIESLSDVIARLSSPQGRRAVLHAQSPSAAGETTVQEPSPATTQESRPRALWRELLTADLNTLE
ncbi:MAG TPA: S49 family peptidase [Agromyces sp.]